MTNSQISESQFPALYIAANKTSLDGQRRFLTATKVRLIAVLAASVFSVLISADEVARLAAISAAVSFGVALVTELYLLRVRPDRYWYDGRAAAESAKTLTWRFVVGGRPFGKDEISDAEAERLLLDRLRDVVQNLKGVPLTAPPSGAQQISSDMREVRSASLKDRRREYLIGRIGEQRDWYASKAKWNEARGAQWMIALGILEAAALAAAVLLAAEVLAFDMLGVAAAAVAGGAAWTQTKQYQTLASAYSVASQELAEISSRAHRAQNEGEWAHFVDQSEQAISREHTMWRASRA